MYWFFTMSKDNDFSGYVMQMADLVFMGALAYIALNPGQVGRFMKTMDKIDISNPPGVSRSVDEGILPINPLDVRVDEYGVKQYEPGEYNIIPNRSDMVKSLFEYFH